MRIQTRPIIIAEVILVMVILDLVKFLTIGGSTIVNWHSFIHPFWVIGAIAYLFVAASIDRPKLWRSLFGLYLIIFLASYLNQYAGFTAVLTYNCMLFNAIFAVAHYLAGRR